MEEVRSLAKFFNDWYVKTLGDLVKGSSMFSEGALVWVRGKCEQNEKKTAQNVKNVRIIMLTPWVDKGIKGTIYT